MKTKILTISILLISFALIFNACKKEDVEKAVSSFIPNSFTVDGKQIKFVANVGYNETLKKFTVTGVSLGGEVISLLFGDEIKTYTNISAIGETTVQFTATFKLSESSTAIFTATDGTLTLSKADITNKKVTGTFAFKAINLSAPTEAAKNITSGNFTN